MEANWIWFKYLYDEMKRIETARGVRATGTPEYFVENLRAQ
jgi:hypothetical protein